jgi:hypothetical protein
MRTTLIQRVLFSAAALVSAYSAHAVTIDEAINNMSPQVTSEAQVIDPRYDWQQHPSIIMGAPRGDAIPSWWTGNRPEWTKSLLTWFQVFEAQGNAASNSRVQVRNLRVYVLSQSTRQWSLVDVKETPDVDLWQYPFERAGANSGKRSEESGGISVKPAYPNFHHGYGNKQTINAPDVRAVYVSMDFRLVVDDANKPDDRANARYVLSAGADYYPGDGQDWNLGYAPGVGQGRLLLASNDWRTTTMLVPNASYGSSMEEMRTNPPPLQ